MPAHLSSLAENETMVPVLPCSDVSGTLDFFRALGFAVTYEQTRPYLYLSFHWRGVDLHYGQPRQTFDPAEESTSCLVMVDSVAEYHRTFTELLRARYGKVLATGRPRITRFRPGQSRFTLVDPSGNSVIVIQRDEPATLDYGGSTALTGLSKVIDNARILRDFKNDDATAAKALDVGLGRFPNASAVDRVRALAALVELAVALDDTDTMRTARDRITAISLTDTEKEAVADELDAAYRLKDWLGP